MARVVDKGFSQEPNVVFNDTFAPVGWISSIRIVMRFAAEYALELHQLDFISAYFNGNIKEKFYIEVPEGL